MTTPIPNFKIPTSVDAVLAADFSSVQSREMAKEFKFNIGKIVALTGFIADVFYKKIALPDLEKAIQAEFKLTDQETKKLALELCWRRFLIVDDEWFHGEVAEKIKQLGGAPASYATFISQYHDEMRKQKHREEADAEKEAAEKAKEAVDEFIQGETDELPNFVEHPEEEMASTLVGFKDYLLPCLISSDVSLKVELNIRLMTMLLADEEKKKFQNDLINTLYENQELLAKNKIVVKDEKVDPSVANWLKDYVRFVSIDEIANSIKKAQYLTQSPNTKSLTLEEKRALDNLLILFVGLKNFYVDASRKELSEITLFHYTEEEVQAYLKANNLLKLSDEPAAANKVKASESSSAPLSISELYQGQVNEAAEVLKEKAALVETTRKEINKVADYFEDVLLKRRRFAVIACLETLAEIGGLDNLLVEDKRFQMLLFGYFKRNNLQAEEVNFKKEPYQAKYITFFLKYIFLERLGLVDHEGARLAAKISTIFRKTGLAKYSQLAYLDLKDNKFKWSE